MKQDKRAEILYFLRGAKYVSRDTIRKGLSHLNDNTVRVLLTKLVREGYLKRPFFGAYARTSKQYIPAGEAGITTPFSASMSVDFSTAEERRNNTMLSHSNQISITDPYFLSIISRTNSQRSVLT